MNWLPDSFVHPARVELLTGHHLRPIRAADIDLDMVAVMGSQPRLFSIFGAAWGWPPADLTREDDFDELLRHETEIEAHESFNYALFDTDETALVGCVYIDPPEKDGADAELSWWVIDDMVATPVEHELDRLVPLWISQQWPFTRPRYIGHDLTWTQWLALPDR
jgi:RimJ/RimL family protein N-acetyltransferase